MSRARVNSPSRPTRYQLAGSEASRSTADERVGDDLVEELIHRSSQRNVHDLIFGQFGGEGKIPLILRA